MMVAIVFLISSWLLRYNAFNVVAMHVNNAILTKKKKKRCLRRSLLSPPLLLLQQLLMVNIFSALMIEMYNVTVGMDAEVFLHINRFLFIKV